MPAAPIEGIAFLCRRSGRRWPSMRPALDSATWPRTVRDVREIRTSPCICGVTPGSPLARIMRLGSKGLGGRGAAITQETFMIS